MCFKKVSSSELLKINIFGILLHQLNSPYQQNIFSCLIVCEVQKSFKINLSKLKRKYCWS